MIRKIAERDDFFEEKLKIVKAALQQLKDDKKIIDFLSLGGGEIRRNPDFYFTCIKGPRHVGHSLFHVGHGLFIVRNGNKDDDRYLKVSPLDGQDDVERKIIKIAQRP